MGGKEDHGKIISLPAKRSNHMKIARNTGIPEEKAGRGTGRAGPGGFFRRLMRQERSGLSIEAKGVIS